MEERALLSVGAGLDQHAALLELFNGQQIHRAALNNHSNSQAVVAPHAKIAARSCARKSPSLTPAIIRAPAPVNGSFNKVFTATIALTESATPNWVGYDIDARSLPTGAIINKIVVHHTVTHPRVSDLQVKLYNDSGTEWLIRKNSGGWVANYDEYRTDTTVFAGARAAQLFHYRVADTVVNKLTGSLTGLEIWINYSVPAPVPDLTVAAAHAGTFMQGQTGATYTINVANVGNGPTSGTVTVKDILPAGLTATAIGGDGWTTDLATLTATRSSALAAGASYAPLTVTVDVAGNAPASVVNTVQVSGGGESNTANDTANDPTNILDVTPDLTIAATHVGDFTQGQTGATYTINVANSRRRPNLGHGDRQGHFAGRPDGDGHQRRRLGDGSGNADRHPFQRVGRRRELRADYGHRRRGRRCAGQRRQYRASFGR